MKTTTPYKIYNTSYEQGALDQFENCLNAKGCVQGALMADGHKGFTSPIGSVFKFKDRISAQIVGFDIGCGVACLELDINYKDVDLEQLKTHILKTIPVGFNKHTEPQDTSSLDFTGTSVKLQDIFSQKGKYQLGTLGGGKHDYCFQIQR